MTKLTPRQRDMLIAVVAVGEAHSKSVTMGWKASTSWSVPGRGSYAESVGNALRRKGLLEQDKPETRKIKATPPVIGVWGYRYLPTQSARDLVKII